MKSTFVVEIGSLSDLRFRDIGGLWHSVRIAAEMLSCP
jgi:hypothetical protein